uniref:Non-specific protein-tyrosine kinase n=1 Tax=Strongyloides stercoralis TaxID=6248 RepID=A0A0K0ESG3_STRER
MKRFIYIFYFLWYINTISTSSIVNQNNLHSNFDDLVAIITYYDKVAILNSKEIKIFNQTLSNDSSLSELISQIDITIGPYEKKISDFKFLNNDFISFCVGCKKCIICSIHKKKNCSVILIKKSKCTSISLSWDGNKESNIFLRRTNSGINFKGNLNHILSYSPDKLFIDYSNDYSLPEIGYSNDFDLSINQEVIYSFSYKNYTYFLGHHNRRKDLEKIYDHKQYEEFFEGNISIAKLIRVCNKDNSKDIITRMDITLTCNDFDINNSFITTGAFLIEEDEKLLVSFKSIDNNKNQLCSYNLNDVNNRFNEYWDICQVNDIDTTTMCDEISLTSYKKGYEVCSILSRSGSRHSDVICTKFGQQSEKISNCDAGNDEYSKVILGRHGWLDCFYPFEGTFEASFNSSLISTKLNYSKRSKMLFFSDNNGNGQLVHLVDKKTLKLVRKKTSIFKVKYPFALSFNTDDFYNLDEDKEMNIELFNCSNLYKTCNDIHIAEMGELKCKWCALENGKQMSINIEKEKCGDNLTKGWVFDKEDKCPFKISNIKCDSNTITIMDNSFTKRTKFSACNVKINCNIINTTTTCFIPQDLKHCPFKIEEVINNNKTFYQYIYECSISDNINKQRAKNSYTLSEMQLDKNGYVSPTIPRHLFGDMPIEYIIQPNEYKIDKEIGSGNFGLIYCGILKKNYSNIIETVAFKELKKNDSNWSVWEREINALIECKHPNIVEFKGMTYDIKKGYIMVMEYMEKGDLKKYLMNPTNTVTSLNIIHWILNILDAMIYLHDKDFTHRDLACRNILLTEVLEAKLSDFGLSRQLNNNGLYIGDKNYPVQLPLQWTAPECLTGDDEYTFSRFNDIWAFSVVVWEMFTRKYCPYPNTYFDEYKKICLTESLPFGSLEYNNFNDWIKLTNDCRNLIPQHRPTFVKIKEIVTEIANKTLQEEYIIKM